MGKVASRCLSGCEGGKKEVGEENLEVIANSTNRINFEENKFNNEPIKAKSAHKKKEDENEIENLKKIIEEYKRKLNN